jgi:DNA-binding GntR family transcriptional regulator
VTKLRPGQLTITLALTIFIVRRACEVATDADIARIRQVIEQQKEALKREDHKAFLALDEAFHRGLANAAECAYAWKVIEEAKAQMDRVRFLSIPDATPVNRLILQHQAILEAIATGRASAAEQAMKDHLSEILKSLPRLARAFPEMFEHEEAPAPVKAKKAAR